MAVEKTRKLRRVEFVCTDGCVNPVTHLEYEISVVEDGQQIASSTQRENVSCDEAKAMLQGMETYTYPEAP